MKIKYKNTRLKIKLKNKRRQKLRANIFQRAGFTACDYQVTALCLGVIVATSSDANTRLKCDHALKSLRKLNRIVRTSILKRG